jgi:hypothetical protein
MGAIIQLSEARPFSRPVRPDIPSHSADPVLAAVVQVLEDSGHFCHAADWVMHEPTRDILRAT